MRVRMLQGQDLALDLYHMPAPDVSITERRQIEIEAMKQRMGDKYLLAVPVQRITPREVCHDA